jgi:ferrous iron transport protein B
LRAEAQAVWDRAQLDCPDGSDIAMAEAAFDVCSELASKVVTQVTPPHRRWTQSIDRVVLHPWLGLPIFLSVMYALFFFSINVGGAFQDFFDILSRSFLVGGVQHALQWLHAPAWLTALLAQGVGGGINTTVTFIPVIGALFLFLCFLEDCGYMARAAFVMDRLMVRLGLPGKAFIPMVVGFGCNVPAVMGARTLANPRDRILAVMMMPFMSCGARLAIFSVFAAAFFPRGGQDIIFVLYLLGVAVALFTGWVLRRTVLPGKPAPLLMSMPDYHWPQLSALLRHAWSRLKAFLWRAGRTIVVVCMVLGLLQSVRWHDGALQPAQGKHSLLADVGRWATPVFEPMGIQPANWPATVGLATGVLAKEVVVGTLNHLYVRDDVRTASSSVWQARASVHQALASVPANLSALSDAWKNPLVASEADHTMGHAAMGSMVLAFGSVASALAYMLFVLLYFPCVSTMAVMRRELGWSWALFSMAWTTGLAYVLAVVLYQVLAVARVAPIAAAWHTALPLGVLLGVLLWMRRYAERALQGGTA